MNFLFVTSRFISAPDGTALRLRLHEELNLCKLDKCLTHMVRSGILVHRLAVGKTNEKFGEQTVA